MIDMKRVIALSWFKTIVNRLFGPEEDNEHETKQVVNIPESDYSRSALKPSTSFRFPMISDAEIYGWDEEEGYEQKPSNREPVNNTDEESYTTIPLYENDRWMRESDKGNVYRVGSNKKVDEAPTTNVKKKTRIKSEVTSFSKPEKEIVKNRSGKPFTPTEVPSPVHGYYKRSLIAERIIEEAQVELEPVPESIPNEEMISQAQPFESQNDLSKPEQLIEAVSEEIEQTYFIENEFVEDSIVQEVSVHTMETTDGIKEIVEIPTFEKVQTLEEVKSVEHNPAIVVEKSVLENMTADEQFQPTDGRVQAEEDPEPIEEELVGETETVQHVQKERTVPFNVLMLKSDKEKADLHARVSKDAKFVLESKEMINSSSTSTLSSPMIPEPITTGSDIRTEVAQNEMNSTDETIEEEPHYAFPSLNYLIPPEEQIEDVEWLVSQSEKLEEALSHFAVQATVIDAVQGPTVTRFELTVGHGTKVSKIRNLTDDLKLALAAEDIRIQAPIPGRSSIGIEIPNRKTRPVRISEVIGTDQFQNSTSPLEAVLGLGLTGAPVTLDLRKMPHGMIAGATGSGKSVCINSILVSLLYKASPTDLKMMLIDPKMVELAPFNGIPHLISPVITDVKAATAALKWAVAEMERRYELLAHAGVRDIERYNKVVMDSRRFSLKMPYLLIVIDELADLMMMAPADVEVSISRIAQKARACGIHLIIATQRPSVDVITGTIKANIPTRIAFSVSSQIDSRTIIDTPGAERLLGKGDMLYIGNGQSAGVRLQGTFVTDDEIERIIEHVQNEAKPNYLFGQDELLANAIEDEETDPLFDQACRFILDQGSASTSLLQRNFSIGYNRAAKLIDRMEKNGFISGQKGSKARDVFLTEGDFERFTNPSE